jgi:hypothetical protein
VPFEFVDATGTVVPDMSDTKVEVEDEYKDALGEDLDVNPETIAGVLIAAETSSRVGIATNNAQLANQINPNLAGGTFLDAIWALTGGTRAVATSSTFTVDPDLTGVPSTPLPIGILAETVNGDQFISTAAGNLGAGGATSISFESVEKGPIPCAIGELSILVAPTILGLETIDNTVAATLGVAQQDDVSVRAERKLTLALLGSGLAVSVFSHVRAVAGVASLKFLENVETTVEVIEGVSLAGNSIWVCVSGGADVDVAFALLESKSGGCAWNNGKSSTPVTEILVDPTSGQSYTVEFDRPDDVPVAYEVTIAPTSVGNFAELITNAILDYAAGLISGQEGLVVGADVSPFEAAGAINIEVPAINVTKVQVKKLSGGAFAPTTIVIDPFEQASVIESSITVLVA